MNLSRSIDFLLDRGGPVTRYRLRREILRDLSPADEAALLEDIRQTPHFRLVETYRKPDGYIGIGMHSWDKFKETPLQDGEAAARLLSNYAIPADWPIVADFIAALRNEETLRQEFSYYEPEMARFENRFRGLRNGAGLMVLVYACQAMLGRDDEALRPFIDVSYEAFRSMLDIGALEDITVFNPNRRAKYNYPYLPEEVPFPCQYHLETLAYTRSWRTEERVAELTRAINHLHRIMKPDNFFNVKVGSQYVGPLWAYCRPFTPFTGAVEAQAAHRKTLTLLAMVGGDGVDVVRQTLDALEGLMAADGVLRVTFDTPYRKKCFRDSLHWPTPYAEIALEPNHRAEDMLWCELTFWAVQLFHLAERNIFPENAFLSGKSRL